MTLMALVCPNNSSNRIARDRISIRIISDQIIELKEAIVCQRENEDIEVRSKVLEDDCSHQM